MERLLESLTPAQREAVEHLEGPLLILAGPGSGKTRVITHRIAYLLQHGVSGREILALTFTNKAADEMRARVERLTGDRSVWLGTFHRFCARLLRQFASFVGLEANYTIYDAEDSIRALRRVVRKLKIDPARFTPEATASAISWAKNNLIGPDQYQPRPGHPLGALIAQVYPEYQALLARSNAADFDDLLLHVATLLRENPEVRSGLDERYRFVLVDEYQDTNLAQYAIARALSIDHPNLAVTGDPDQSIYGWRGANLSNILEFENDFPAVRVVRLERNYRSTRRILHVAATLIAHNRKRKKKDLFTENGEGPRVRLVTYADHKEEAEAIAGRIADEIHAGRRRARDYAVFYRVNALSRAFEFALRASGVPFQIVRGVEFFQRKEIKDILAFVQLVNNPRDDLALLRVINTPPRGIGQKTVERLASHATRHGQTLLEAAHEAPRVEGLAKRAVTAAVKFTRLFDRIAQLADAPVEELLGHVLTETGYKRQFEGSEDVEDQDRLANLEELLTVAREFDERNHAELPLEQFLEETSLVSDTDAWDEEVDRVTLMTLHASKGLEFPVVHVVAAEQGLLPHERSRESDDQLEEERRLLFVGITRAQEELQLSLARYRDFRGQRKMTVPSQFLMELPRAEMEVDDHAAMAPSWAEPYDEPHADEPHAEEPGFPWEASSPSRPAAGLPPSQGAAAVAGLTTAAEMVASGPVPAASPDNFRQGMRVRHPVYGVGRVVALGGRGPSRTATVDFGTNAGQVKFKIADSPLRPIK